MPAALVVADARPDPEARSLAGVLCRALPPGWQGRPVAPAGALRAAPGADALVAAGLPLGGPAATRLVPAALAVRALDRPVVLMGVTAPPRPGGHSAARALARTSDLLVVADEGSALALGRCGLQPPFRVGADPLWGTVEVAPGGPERAESAHVFAGARGPFEAVTAAARALAGSGLQVRLQPWTGARDDLAAAAAVAAALGGPAELVTPPADLGAARAALAGAAVAVCTRPAQCVCAGAAEVPFVALGDDAQLAETAAGLSQPHLPPDASPERAAGAAVAAAGGPGPNPAAARARAASAEEGFRLLRLVLSGGRSEEADEITGLPLKPDPWAL